MSTKKVTTTLPPTLEVELEALQYLEKYNETKNIMYLRFAIKKNPEVLFLDERMRYWMFEIRYKASIPHPTKEYKDAREFMEDLRLLKPEKQGEILIFFGSGYRLESSLGIKFVHNSKAQLIPYDDASMIYFIDELKQIWKDYREKNNIYKFNQESAKRRMISELCKELGLHMTNDDLSWGSTYYATEIALTILGIVNKQRFQILFSKHPNHELKKYIPDYFSFHTLHNLFKKTNKVVTKDDIKEASSKIKSAKNEDNPFVIDYTAGIPTNMFLAREIDRYYIVENEGTRKPTYREKIEFYATKHMSKKASSK